MTRSTGPDVACADKGDASHVMLRLILDNQLEEQGGYDAVA
jgi:hypothetical protein